MKNYNFQIYLHWLITCKENKCIYEISGYDMKEKNTYIMHES